MSKGDYYLDVVVDGGKYRFIMETAQHKLKVLRYGEEWIEDLQLYNVKGGKALIAVLFELEELKNLYCGKET